MFPANRLMSYLRPASDAVRGRTVIEVRTDPSDGNLVVFVRPAEPAAATRPTWAYQAERWNAGDRRYVVEVVSADREVAAARVEWLRTRGLRAALVKVTFASAFGID